MALHITLEGSLSQGHPNFKNYSETPPIGILAEL